VQNLMLMAAGIDFSTREGLLNRWTDTDAFDVDAYGNCPAEFLQSSFLMLKPVGNFVEKPIALFERLENEKFVDEFFTMETWLNDNIPVPGEVFREFVKYLYQRNLLVKNEMPVGRHTVNLKNITCPILNLMATKDDLVPCAQSEALTIWWDRRTAGRSSCRRGTSDSRWAPAPRRNSGRRSATGWRNGRRPDSPPPQKARYFPSSSGLASSRFVTRIFFEFHFRRLPGNWQATTPRQRASAKGPA